MRQEAIAKRMSSDRNPVCVWGGMKWRRGIAVTQKAQRYDDAGSDVVVTGQLAQKVSYFQISSRIWTWVRSGKRSRRYLITLTSDAPGTLA